MGKASKRRRDAQNEHDGRYLRALGEAVNALLPRFRAFEPPVLGWHSVGRFGPTPNDQSVFYVVATELDRHRAEDAGMPAQLQTETLAELERRNFPGSGQESLTVRIVSQEAIDAGGGSFLYFR